MLRVARELLRGIWRFPTDLVMGWWRGQTRRLGRSTRGMSKKRRQRLSHLTLSHWSSGQKREATATGAPRRWSPLSRGVRPFHRCLVNGGTALRLPVLEGGQKAQHPLLLVTGSNSGERDIGWMTMRGVTEATQLVLDKQPWMCSENDLGKPASGMHSCGSSGWLEQASLSPGSIWQAPNCS